MMKYNRVFILLVPLVFLLSCSLAEKKLIVVLFDASDSTIEEKRRETYVSEFNDKILSSLQGGDRVIGDKIADNPLAQATYPVNLNIPAYSIFGDETERKENAQAGRALASSAALNLFNSQNREIGKTKILDSLRLAEQAFASYPGYRKKILVVFSDMIEDSDNYSFQDLDLTSDKIAEIIKAQGILPDLKGVKVYVSGATASTTGGLKTNKITSIKAFWLAYFSACGASLAPSNYGSAIIQFEGAG